MINIVTSGKERKTDETRVMPAIKEQKLNWLTSLLVNEPHFQPQRYHAAWLPLQKGVGIAECSQCHKGGPSAVSK